MKLRTLSLITLVVICGLLLPATAQDARAEKDSPAAKTPSGDNWYYGTEEPEAQKSIARQKSELRAQQRMDRLASLRWYGFTPGRPTAAGMPFTTMYSPEWTRPGGRPYAWYTGYPTVIYNHNFGHYWW